MTGSSVGDVAEEAARGVPMFTQGQSARVGATGLPRLLPPADAEPPGSPVLWDPATGRFDANRLRAAIVARGWTVRAFSAAAGVSHETVYRALRRSAVSDRTVVRIVAALETRPPSELLDG